MNSFQNSIKLTQLNVLIGDYIECLNFILNKKFEEWLIPKLLWIDFRVIPLTFFYHASHLGTLSKNSCYFLEILSIQDYNLLLKSTMLSKFLDSDFSSVIVNYPPFCTNNNENWTYLKKLANLGIVIVLTPRDLFPIEECTRFVVDSE